MSRTAQEPATVETVTGPVPVSKLGFTLTHEHLLIGWPGANLVRQGPSRDEVLKICVDHALELVAAGIQTIVDPCPLDLGRDPVLAAEVAQASGLNVILASGLYNETIGFPYYFRERTKEELTDILVQEFEEGIGTTGIRPGVIKCASGKPSVPDPHRSDPALGRFELRMHQAAGAASKRLNVPIIAHNDESFPTGIEQLQVFVEAGASAERVVIAHSDGVGDMYYLLSLLESGANLGFDRFGLESVCSDEVRLACLLGLIHLGFEERLFISTDMVMCWLGKIHPSLRSIIDEHSRWKATHIVETVIPRLLAAGVSQETVDVLTIENPRRLLSAPTLSS